MIHPSAYIHETAVIKDGADVGPMAYIGEHCVIESGAKIGAKATVQCHTTVGEGSFIAPNAHIGGDPQDISYRGELSKLVIGKNTVIREFATVNRATNKEDGVTVVGDNCFIMSGCHIAHDCKIGNGVIMANYASLAGHVHVGDRAVISGLTGVHQFTRIGSLAMVAGLSRITKDIPPFCTVTDDTLVGLNTIGLRRNGVTAEERAELKRAYKLFTDKELRIEDVKKELEKLQQFGVIKLFNDFLVTSKRGITRTVNKDAEESDE